MGRMTPRNIPRPFYVDLPGKYYYFHTWGARFKPSGRRAVRGGRWQVRKTSDGRWRAWTSGQASKFNMFFYTHEDAIEWAQLVAAAYADNLTMRSRYDLLLHAKLNLLRYNRRIKELKSLDRGGLTR